MMVIFLPPFVLPGVHLIWFSTGLFPLQLSSFQHPQCLIWQLHLFQLPICGRWRALIAVPPFQTVLRRLHPHPAERLGIKPDEKFFAKCSIIAKSFCSFIAQSNYEVCFQLFSHHLMLVCWSSWDTFKRSYFGRIRCLVVIKCFKWFSQGCLHGLKK